MEDKTITDSAVAETKKLMSFDFSEYWEKIQQTVEKKASEVLSLANKERTGNTQEAIKQLPRSHAEYISNSMKIKTFETNFKESDDVKTVYFAEEGGHKYWEITISSEENLKEATVYQSASIAVECIGLTMNLAGFAVTTDKKVIEKCMEKTVKYLNSSKTLRKCVKAIKDAYISGENVVKKMLWLVITIYREKDFLDITKGLFKCGTVETTELMAQVTVFVATLIRTSGVEALAELVAREVNETPVKKKFHNMIELEAMEKYWDKK